LGYWKIFLKKVGIMIINCDNCVLRRWKYSDLRSLVENANNFNIARNMRDEFPFPYTTDDGKEWIDFAQNKNLGYNFAISINKKAIGGIGLTIGDDIERKSAEVGYWLGEKYWGNNFTSSALKGIVVYAFKDLKLERIFATPFERNIASRRVLEKNDFILEGVLRKSVIKYNKLYDQALYARIREDL
jgi:RimJ/RimL family protein N-acetyltransferase